MPQMTLDISPELGARLDAWSRETRQTPEVLALGLLEEFFDDSDTGARLSAEVEAGRMRTFSMEEAHSELSAVSAMGR